MKTKLLVCIAGLLLVFTVKGQAPVASFTVSPVSGCLNSGVFSVSCTNTSTNAATSIFDYGDGSTPSASPNHIYTTSGVFTITLTATNAGGTTSTTTKTVTILAQPTVQFSANTNTGCFPLPVQFSDNSTANSGTITAWSWDFGDGNISNVQNPYHIYTSSGSFPVSLTVTTSNGCSSSLQKPTFIQITTGVSAGFTDAVSASCNPPILVTFTNQTTGNAPNVTYTWNFGDGSPVLTQTTLTPGPTHNYNTTGGFSASLIATSTAGCTDTVTNIVHVNGGGAISDFSAPDTVCIGVPVTFQNITTPMASTTNWDFGDGGTSTQVNPTYTFLTGGTFNVQLKNTFGPCSDLVSKPIVILNKPVAGFTASVTGSCTPPLAVNFTNTSTNGLFWSWDFGDGSASTQQNPSHTFTAYGKYTVKLIVSSASGCIDSIVKSQFIQIIKPTVAITDLPAFGCIPYTFTPTSAIVSGDPVATYAWDFGDGTTSSLANPPGHVYSVSGKYGVKLTITTNGGCSVSFVDTVKVGSNKPTPDFTFSPNPDCVHQTVQFKDLSSGTPPPDQWSWDFGTGNHSSLQNPSVAFDAPGTFTITLTVYTAGCPATLTKMITVTPPSPQFTYLVNCVNKTQVSFADGTVGATSWFWDFGDGTTFTGQNPPTHTFTAGGTYQVSLSASNGTCTNVQTQTIKLTNQKADFSISSTVACKNSPVTFTVTNSNSAYISSYSWDLGDTVITGPKDTVIIHGYKNAGAYMPSLTVTDVNGCTDVQKKPIQINGPTANFSTTASNGCKGLVANFTDASVSDGTHNIVSWVWDFGDGTIQTYTAPPFSHIYLTQGNFTVNLKVVDASGCSDSLSQVNLINIYQPAAQFVVPDSMSCPGSAIQFSNTSSGYGLTSTWDFGDGTPVSSANDPAHSYSAVGNYVVLLQVSDQYGCKDAISSNISVDTPHASFKISDSIAKCPPLQVNFTFTGHYNKTVRWSFGDGATSTLLNPSHIYTIPGTYVDTLIVTSPGGCTSMALDTIIILGPYGTFTYSPLTGCNPLTVNFSVNTSGVVKYTWDFNDGQSQVTTTPSVTYTYTKAGNYLPIVILQDASSPPCNVPVIGSDSVRVIGSVPAFGIDKNLLCGSGTIQFSDSTKSNGAITGYLWDFGDGNTSTDQNPLHFYAGTGLYSIKLTVTTQGGCQDFITKNALIKVVAVPNIDIGGAISQCVPSTLNLQGIVVVADTSALTWNWDFHNGQTSAIQNPPAQVYPAAGSDSVRLIVINSSGCADTVSKNFLVYPLPPTNAGVDTTICLGQNVQLLATGAAAYNWLPPINSLSCANCDNPIATPLTTTTYIVSGSSTFGCLQSDTIVVNVVQPNTLVVAPAADSICIGQTASITASGEDVYTWLPAAGLSNPAIPNPVTSPDSTTIYQVIGSDSHFCFSDTQYVKITVFPYPTINLGPDVTLPVGSSYQINGVGSSDIVSINWSPFTALSCTDCLTPIASPINTTLYIARVVNNGGCAAADSINIIVTCNNANLFVPNTFSPNGDGMNDVFYVRGKGLSTIQSMRVFNRWGQVVFEKRNFAANDPSVGWDGTMNGKKAPIDVYIYTIEVICENSVVVPYHGNVALIR